MRQILQSLKDGNVELASVPAPSIKEGCGIVRTRVSLISAGTEKMLLDFGKSNLINKARQQPDKVRQVLRKISTDGILPTIDAVKSRLDTPLPLGYCNVGTLLKAGDLEFGKAGITEGSRVVSNGPHAEIVRAPRLLCTKVPDTVTDETAAFTVMGAIALQGIRLSKPTIGETVAVFGLGLIGQMAVQILKANGCRVIGIDVDSSRCEIAQRFGADTVDISAAEDPVSFGKIHTRGNGVDAVLITATTSSSKPVHQAAEMCRKRGRIILVGVTGLELNRSDFYEKELTFQVSCSYGPGRYDPLYEEHGKDYPQAYVRWTEQRNFEAVLDLMADGKIDVNPLITHRYPFDSAPDAYDMIAGGKEPYLGILLKYDIDATTAGHSVTLTSGRKRVMTKTAKPVVGMIGAGTYAGRILLPALSKTGSNLKQIISSGGVSGTHLGTKFGFQNSGTESNDIFKDDGINTVIVCTRHNNHAEFVLNAVKAGKHVFCEKPLCLNAAELSEIDRVYQQMQNDEDGLNTILMVGFNRRFSPLIKKVKELLGQNKSPISMVMNVNAGAIPADHWTQDAAVGGGRLIGEACHFIDLMLYICSSWIIDKDIVSMKSRSRDTFSIQLRFENGSIGNLNYFSNGNNAYPKERLQIFSEGRVLEMDNFRKLEGWGWPGFKSMKLWRQDKGHNTEIQQFISAIASGDESPIGFDEIKHVTRHTIELADLLMKG